MDNVAYIALSRQTTLQRQMDITANNLANVDTAGFKVEQLLLGTEAGAPARNAGIQAPAQFVLDSGVGRDFAQGDLRTTGRPLDVAIEGQAFFKVSTAAGERYTRDGRFSTDATGQLTTADGHPVLDDSGGPITLDPVKPEPTISADGIVSQGSERVGRIGLARFDTLSVLSKDGSNLYANLSNAAAQSAPDVRMHQGMLEGSNVKPIVEITQLIEVQRAYERMAKIVDQQNEQSKNTIDRLGRVS